MADNLKRVIYLSNTDYNTLISTGEVTVGGTTITYSDEDLYLTPESVATTSSDGLMSAADKTKLNGIAAGAQVNPSTYLVSATKADNTLTIINNSNSTTTVTYSDIGAASADHEHDSTYLRLDGSNTMTGVLNLKASGNNETNIGDNGIRWNSTSLPQLTSPQYFCVIDGFAQGGRQKWSGIAQVQQSLGIISRAAESGGTTLSMVTTGEKYTWNNKADIGDIPDVDDFVIGPASSTTNAIATFDGTTGKVIKDSGYSASDFLKLNSVNVKSSGSIQITNSTDNVFSRNNLQINLNNSTTNDPYLEIDHVNPIADSYTKAQLHIDKLTKIVKAASTAEDPTEHIYELTLPNKSGTLALLEDINLPIIDKSSIVFTNGYDGRASFANDTVDNKYYISSSSTSTTYKLKLEFTARYSGTIYIKKLYYAPVVTGTFKITVNGTQNNIPVFLGINFFSVNVQEGSNIIIFEMTPSVAGTTCAIYKELLTSVSVNGENALFVNSISMGRRINSTVGLNSTALGQDVVASGENSHATGYRTTASGKGSHTEGYQTSAPGAHSHVEGNFSHAYGDYSHAEGHTTAARGRSQHVFGEWNVADTTGTSSTRGTYVEIVGNGWNNTYSNARTLDWNGNEYLAGTIDANGGIAYLTTAPTSANTGGGIKIVVLSSEPATKYDGYLYIITGS